MASISLSHITKSFGRRKVIAVNDVTLEIPSDHFVVLLGPSGCGKSTTLRMIAGLEKPDQGEIRINDRVVNDVPPQRRNLPFVFQNYALYPHMSVANNIGFPLKMQGVSRTEIQRRVAGVGQTLGLGELLERYPAQLSGGERQRVALGRAIIRDPDAFLLDEPLSNLDAQLRGDMRLELAQLQKRLRATFIFVTHDQVEAMTLADKIAIMRDGVLHQYANPDEIYHQPADRFVAGFIGSPMMNFIEGKLEREGLNAVLKTSDLSLTLGPIVDIPVSQGQDVVLGIRPEHFLISPEGNNKLMVEIVETLGSQTFVYGNLTERQRLSIEVDPALRAAAGDCFKFEVNPKFLHFFSTETGQRIAIHS
ncbi:MAG: ABC transporter ATP-binding protein [Dehalococcoidia bacterium]|jgi:multiple sugar transport system ATP-binding protein|nr:ABC transporter ATP-binding protein [Dehalococcoidia bacterium]MDP7673970.1 ABC transporter ATP-binding protein [Dehalococcoidia bacterium]|tara:strand:- start:4370 stop:5461 length:1092 start_codon:yes stop_codon:yes gene_type:complete